MSQVPSGASQPNTGYARASAVTFTAGKDAITDITHVTLVTGILFLTKAQEAALLKDDKLWLVL